MASPMESPNAYPESPMDSEDVVYPCKGCGDILEEGKAFELAGNRWHIDCFRCNTCGTLLDSDANLLLLGDGSLICNNCTYSCSACNNKIEDLAILTGDQAFCSGCFRCRNCKRKIENLRYARTSQGIFCMSCHESLMARRRKKARTPKTSAASTPGAEKALPSLPPNAASASQTAFASDVETPPDTQFESHVAQQRSPTDRQLDSRIRAAPNNFRRDASPLSDDLRKDGPTLPASTYNQRRPSNVSNDDDDDDPERGFLPMAFDPTPVNAPPLRGHQPTIPRKEIARAQESSPPAQKENLLPRDYFGGAANTNGRLSAKPPTRDTASREALREDGPGTASERSVSTEREQDRERQPKPSPHILFQEKGRNRKRDTSGASTPGNGSITASPVVANAQDRASTKLKGPPLTTDPNNIGQDGFKLQDVPGAAKGRSRKSSKTGVNSPMLVSPVDGNHREDKNGLPISPISDHSQNSGVNPFDDPKHKQAQYPAAAPVPPRNADRGLPLRGDSLANKAKATPSDPSTPTAASTVSTQAQSQQSSHERNHSSSSMPSSFTDAQSTLSRDNSSSRPESHLIRSSFDAPPPRAANRPSAPSKSVANDDFIAPRHPPPPPPSGHRHTESISTMQSSDDRRSIDGQLSPGLRSAGLPKYSLDGGFSMDDEMGRILRGEQAQNSGTGNASPSVLRRVSNAVKHGRSFSDRAAPGGKSPRNGSLEISSPAVSGTPSFTSPNRADGLDSLRSSLRRAQTHIAELEAEKLSMQEKLNGSSEIKAVNTELREKRSTMAFLDTQREMVVRELEIMTEHLTKAKDNNQPLDLGSLKTNILKDFAESLQRLKDSMGGQIEDLMHKRNELTDEIGSLIQMKDKGFQEYESLSSKNSQLQQHNGELVRNIQHMYQDNRALNGAQASGGANGLGIYHPGARVETSGSAEVRNLNIVNTDPSMPNLLHDIENEPATVLTVPQVVNIRKGGKPNKFNWRRGGEKITGKVTKGIKGAILGTDRAPTGQNGPYSIGLPYNQTHQTLGGSDQGSVNSKENPGYAFFGQKNGGGKQGVGLGHMKNDSSSNLASPDGSVLFGSELSARVDFEGSMVPNIVLQCIGEVERRGIEVEGIYRKSGGAGQVKSVQQGFEKDGDFDISDEDLDIHAVTSALKQYFRKLPTPLITYDVYDPLLAAGQMQDKQKQVSALRRAVDELPDAHQACLELLIGHLVKVMAQEPKNLMTSLNLAVVFAPTIMRPESIEREMSDMQVQRIAVQALLEHSTAVWD